MLFELGVPPPPPLHPSLRPDLDRGGGGEVTTIPGQDGTPSSHPDLGQGYPPQLTWDGGILWPDPGQGYPPWCEVTQTEAITFPHPSNAGGNSKL